MNATLMSELTLTPTTVVENRKLNTGTVYHQLHLDVDGIEGVTSALVTTARPYSPLDVAMFDADGQLLPDDDPRCVEHASEIKAFVLDVIEQHYPGANR